MNEAFIHIKKNGDHFTVRGVSSCFVGHRIQKPDKDKPDGIFAEWSWNGTCLTVRNDRYGFQPLFYFANENEIAVSDSIHMLLAAGAPRELDDAGLATFLRLGHFLGEDTAFRAIRMLASDANLEWREGKLK